MSDLLLQLKDYRLTTAEIVYRLPDYPDLFQVFIWQDLDVAPKFPVLHKFLEFWQHNLEGPLHTVRVASKGLISPGSYVYAEGEFRVQ